MNTNDSTVLYYTSIHSFWQKKNNKNHFENVLKNWLDLFKMFKSYIINNYNDDDDDKMKETRKWNEKVIELLRNEFLLNYNHNHETYKIHV